MTARRFFLCIVLYALAARFFLAHTTGRTRTALFAVLNLLGVFALLANSAHHFEFSRALAMSSVYAAWVALQFWTLHLFADRDGWRLWLAFFTPLTGLVIVKYAAPFFELALNVDASAFTECFVGISYL